MFEGKAGFAWFRTTLAPSAQVADALHFESVDDNATVYLNGEKLMAHRGWNSAFEVPVREVWKTGAPNELAVLVENENRAGGIMGEVGLRVGAPVAAAAAGASYDDSAWRTLDLPHDWGVEGDLDINLPAETGELPWAGVGWYSSS